VLVVDHAAEAGRKILISGGGRCNFTNLHTAPDRYLSQNAHFARSALSRYTLRDFLALVEAHGIAWHEKTLGQLFCDGSARQIVAMLLEECAKGAVDFALGAPLGEVRHADGRYRGKRARGRGARSGDRHRRARSSGAPATYDRRPPVRAAWCSRAPRWCR
jgi:predicted flavoprotein YhiN